MMTKLLEAMVRGYRKYISPCFPPSCRFYPTCSEYALQALKKYSWPRALWLIVKRIARCNPLFPGGYDPLP
ncbi:MULTISPECIES: membrane protein insertion efficiency factor YidD [unclassified Clostridium]|nr:MULTISPECIES: membrane protein insertion efficiency factor YidD [Clostridia]